MTALSKEGLVGIDNSFTVKPVLTITSVQRPAGVEPNINKY